MRGDARIKRVEQNRVQLVETTTIRHLCHQHSQDGRIPCRILHCDPFRQRFDVVKHVSHDAGLLEQWPERIQAPAVKIPALGSMLQIWLIQTLYFCSLGLVSFPTSRSCNGRLQR